MIISVTKNSYKIPQWGKPFLVDYEPRLVQRKLVIYALDECEPGKEENFCLLIQTTTCGLNVIFDELMAMAITQRIQNDDKTTTSLDLTEYVNKGSEILSYEIVPIRTFYGNKQEIGQAIVAIVGLTNNRWHAMRMRSKRND